MKNTFDVPVVFEVEAETAEEAYEHLNRLMRYGFEALLEHERTTWRAIMCWRLARAEMRSDHYL